MPRLIADMQAALNNESVSSLFDIKDLENLMRQSAFNPIYVVKPKQTALLICVLILDYYELKTMFNIITWPAPSQ